MQGPDVCVGNGLVALDLVYGEVKSVQVGGTCGNVLMILAKLGWQVYPVFNVARGEVYSFIKKEFSYWGVNSDYIVENGINIPIIIQQNNLPELGEVKHQYKFTCLKCASPLPKYSSVPVKNIERFIQNGKIPKVYFLDKVSKSSILMAEYYKNFGTLIYFEPSNKDKEELFVKALGLADIIKYSSDRLRDIEVPSRKDVLIIETQGEKGVKFRYKSFEWIHIDGFYLDSIKDTSGCGDWFSAVLIHELLFNQKHHIYEVDLEELILLIKKSQSFSALNCLFEGARGMMYSLSLEQMYNLTEKLRNRKKMVIPADPYSKFLYREVDPNSFLCASCNSV